MSKNCKKHHFKHEDDENWHSNEKKMQKKSQIKKERKNKQINGEFKWNRTFILLKNAHFVLIGKKTILQLMEFVGEIVFLVIQEKMIIVLFSKGNN